MKVTTYAGSLPHFVSHLAPIYLALPDEIRGPFYAKGRAVPRARQLGIDVTEGLPRRLEGIVMVASYEDHRAVGPQPTILVNHGAGQRYSGDINAADHPAYSGGEGRERVALFLSPSEADAEICRRGGARACAMGVPYLDRYHSGPQRERNSPPVVVISFHHDAHTCNETRSSYGHYREHLIELSRRKDELPFTLMAHAHPRWGPYIERFWKRLGVPFIQEFDDVLGMADCYVIDNSSSGPEIASIGTPIVWTSAPWYRPWVNHGGRFWEWTEGIPHIDEPEQLLPAIGCALADLPPHRTARERMVRSVYGDLCDGQATRRAVDAVVELVNAS